MDGVVVGVVVVEVAGAGTVDEGGMPTASRSPQAGERRSSTSARRQRTAGLIAPGYRGGRRAAQPPGARGYTPEGQMPELPDIEIYREALSSRIVGQEFTGLRLVSPFLLRTVNPAPQDVVGHRVTSVERMGKRIIICLDPDLYLALHLMVAGRLHWKMPGAPVPRGSGLAAFDFPSGTLILTEAGSKRRAALHILSGCEALAKLDQGGLEVIGSTYHDFAAALRRENHTLKRALTDPSIISGIGNAYSDEILHQARLSPFLRTATLDDEVMTRLHQAATEVLKGWTDRLRTEMAGEFPEKVTAFRPEMAVHGRYGQACPVCGTRIERIVRAHNECDYCPGCQTGGRILADRSLSRLLKDDWPPGAHKD